MSEPFEDSAPPASSAIAFKEWSGICRALGEGRQSLILRKGGIQEGAGGFQPQHSSFWLFPTYSHQQTQGLRIPLQPEDAPSADPATPSSQPFVPIEVFVVTTHIARIERLEQLEPLEPFHVWSPHTIVERFHYRVPGLWALLVRAYRRPEPYRIAVTPAYEGCKSWVPLAEPLRLEGAIPALSDQAFIDAAARIRAALP